MSRVLFLFPGQGAQYPGMGSDLIRQFSTATAVYEQASETLGYDMEALSKDESGKINLTRFTQPVLLTHSFACLQVFLEQLSQEVNPSYACGHSLGEYGALLCAGSLDFESALRLVSARGELMGQQGGGEMLALSVSAEQLQPLINDSPCELAACNLPEQTVVGGWPNELDQFFTQVESAFPGKRGIRLKTEGAFHTSHMYPAAQEFKSVLESTEISMPRIPVTSNVTGDFHSGGVDDIRSNLYYQLFQPVLWYKNLKSIADAGVDAVVEFGGGLGPKNDPATKRPNLAGTVTRAYRRVSPRPAYHSVINLKTLETTLQKLSA